MIILNQEEVTFKILEQTIFEKFCNLACKALADTLEGIDEELMNNRDKSRYRHKGIKKTYIQTVMGTVEYSRRIYQETREDGKLQHVFLLDEYLKMERIGHISTNLVEKIAERALEESYRKTVQGINSATNASLNHVNAWKVVQKLGLALEKKEKRLVHRFENGSLLGEREVHTLFQEADGVWICVQGKDRPPKGRKKEMKIAMTYEGFKKRESSKKDYVAYNKNVCVGFHNSNEFKKLCEAKIAQIYNTDEIKVRITNGDGAPWIKPDTRQEGNHFQLDPFHKFREVYRNVSDKKQAEKLNEMLKEGKIAEAFDYLAELLIEYKDNEKELKKLKKLYTYLSNNYEGLVSYKLRGLELPKLQEGLEYRNMGVMESNVSSVIALRMKNRKMSWSLKGANNLAKLLAIRASGKFYEVLDGLFKNTVPEKLLEKIVEVVQLSAADVNKRPKKTNIYPMQTASLPFEGQALTEGRKAIRDLVKNRKISDLKLFY